MDADYPITKCIDDQLGRADIARHIADMLYHAPVDHSIVFGLSGTWGSGKTSLLNMVGELLGTYDEPPTVVRFNPWNYPVGTDLVKPFLALLAKEIRHACSDNKARNLADAIGDYADVLASMIPSNFWVLGGLIQAYAAEHNKQQEQKTPEELKQRLIDSLLASHVRVVVMIDDLDRLPNEMVCEVFRLVAAVADFPRVEYLLAYDRKNVVNALRAMQLCDGDEYLEKIVQVPLELPQPSIGALSAAVQRGVEKMPFKTRFDDDELKRIGAAIYNVTLRANTMRDVHRVLNVFEADWLASQEKISPADLLSMSLLRVMYPKMLPWIRSRSSVLAGGSSDGYVISQAEERKKQYLEELNHLLEDPDKAGSVLQLLGGMFPRFASSCALGAERVSDAQLRLERRIACSKILETYLLGTMEAYDFPREEAVNMLHFGTVDELKSFLEQSENDVTATLLTVAGETAEELADDRRLCFARALIRSGSGGTDRLGTLLVPIDRYTRCLEKLFAAMGKKAASELLVAETKGLGFAALAKLASFVNGQELAYGRLAASQDNADKQLISASCLDRVEQDIVHVLNSTPLDVYTLQMDGARTLLYLWNCFDQEAYAEHVTNGLLQDPLAYLVYGSFQLGRYSGGDGGGWAAPDRFGDDISLERVVACADEALRDDTFWSLDPDVRLRLAGLVLCVDQIVKDHVPFQESMVSDARCHELLDEWKKERDV